MALISTISIGELIFRGQLIVADTFEILQVYTIISVNYVDICIPASLGVTALVRHPRDLSERPCALRD